MTDQKTVKNWKLLDGKKEALLLNKDLRNALASSRLNFKHKIMASIEKMEPYSCFDRSQVSSASLGHIFRRQRSSLFEIHAVVSGCEMMRRFA